MRENHTLREKNIVLIGGGTGTSVFLKTLKLYTERITAIVSVADDGGSSGAIRSAFDIVAPGDVRNCLAALSKDENFMSQLLNLRFTERGLRRQSFGNLMLAAMNKLTGSFPLAVKNVSEIFNITGKVLPVTAENVTLEALLEDGTRMSGESAIAAHCARHDMRISMMTQIPPDARLYGECAQAIRDAGVILFCPGSLYTSLIPDLLANGMVEALRESSAVKYWAMNIMTQKGETSGFSLSDHVRVLEAHAGGRVADVIIYNSAPIPVNSLNAYSKENAAPIRNDLTHPSLGAYRLEGVDCISITAEGFIRHDSDAVWGLIDRLEEERSLESAAR